MKVCVIGLGEIGWETFKELKKDTSIDLSGVEISEYRIEELKKFTTRDITNTIPAKCDIYILSVYTPKQIKDVISKIDLALKPLIVIESTMLPGDTNIILEAYEDIDLVLFPHRYNPNDKAHHVFNLNRIMGANNKEALDRAVDFYKKYMPLDKLRLVSLQIAELSKPLENAYRYIEIAIAEEVRMECEKLGIDFNELRDSVNTKWNIDMKEARDGIGLKCLPKDCKFINKFFGTNTLFKTVIDVDKKYREYLTDKGQDTSDYREVDI